MISEKRMSLSVETIEYEVTRWASTHCSPVAELILRAAPSKEVATDLMFDSKIRASSARALMSAVATSRPEPTPQRYFCASQAPPPLPFAHAGGSPPTFGAGPWLFGGAAGGGGGGGGGLSARGSAAG